MREIEVEGKTVTLAVEKGLADLGLRRDQVEVEVLKEPAPGFLGLGAKPAQVRIREKIWGTSGKSEGETAQEARPAPRRTPSRSNGPSSNVAQTPQAKAAAPAPGPAVAARGLRRPPRHDQAGASGAGGHFRRPGQEFRSSAGYSRPQASRPPLDQPPPDTALACSQAQALISETFKGMGLALDSIHSSWDADQMRVKAEIETPDAALLTGKGGKPIESLQYLVTLMLSRKLQTPVAVQVEAAGYWREKEEGILLQVHQAMEMVNRTARPVRLKPMDPTMRRLVHRTLAKHPEIETASEGEGPWRKVVLRPRRK